MAKNGTSSLKNTKSTGNHLKALDILEALSQRTENIGINEISDASGLSQSTIHRILSALVDRHYVIKDRKTKKYRLGFKILALSSNLLDSIGIKQLAQPEMKQLAVETGETIHLVCLDLLEGVYIDKIDTSKGVGLLSKIGKRIPLYCTGAGKSLLAYQSEQWINNYLNTVELIKYTPSTIDSKEMLGKELERIRKLGYSIDAEEHHENINCISAPVLKRDGKVIASISISAPSYRFSIKKALEYKDFLLEKVGQITVKL